MGKKTTSYCESMNLSKNQYLLIQITGRTYTYIAQIVTEYPLVLKVTESGMYSRLKPGGDYIILTYPSREFQKDPVRYLKETYPHQDKRICTGLHVFRPLLEKNDLFYISCSKLDLLWYKIKLWFNK